MVRRLKRLGLGLGLILLAAGLAGPVWAQDCYNATYISTNGSVYGSISYAGQNNYYRVYLSTSGTLTVYTSGSTDTYGYILNSYCSALAYDDDSGTGNNFRISRTLSAGNYYIRVRNYYSSQTGSYVLYTSFSGGGGGGGTGGGSDAGGSCASYMSVSYNSRIYGSISYAGDQDYYRFYFSGGYLLAYTDGSTDTYGYLYNSSCSLVTYNDDGGTNNNFRIYTYRTSGYYYVRVHEFGNNGTGNYTLYLGNGAYTYYEGGSTGGGGTGGGSDAGSSCASYMSVVYNSRIYGSIGYVGDQDYYRFYFSGGYLLAYTDGSTDTYGYLYNSSCSLVTYNDDGGTNNNFRIYTYRTSGYYYVRVHEFGNNGTGNYTLYLGNGTYTYYEGGSGGSGGGTGAGTSCANATSITIGQTYLGSISTAGENDYYRVYVSYSGTLRIYTSYTSSNLDTYGYLYNSSCSLLTYNDDGGTSYNFLISRSVTSGYYYIRVRAFGSSATGTYYLYTSLS